MESGWKVLFLKKKNVNGSGSVTRIEFSCLEKKWLNFLLEESRAIQEQVYGLIFFGRK